MRTSLKMVAVAGILGALGLAFGPSSAHAQCGGVGGGYYRGGGYGGGRGRDRDRGGRGGSDGGGGRNDREPRW